MFYSIEVRCTDLFLARPGFQENAGENCVEVVHDGGARQREGGWSAKENVQFSQALTQVDQLVQYYPQTYPDSLLTPCLAPAAQLTSTKSTQAIST